MLSPKFWNDTRMREEKAGKLVFVFLVPCKKYSGSIVIAAWYHTPTSAPPHRSSRSVMQQSLASPCMISALIAHHSRGRLCLRPRIPSESLHVSAAIRVYSSCLANLNAQLPLISAAGGLVYREFQFILIATCLRFLWLLPTALLSDQTAQAWVNPLTSQRPFKITFFFQS